LNARELLARDLYLYDHRDAALIQFQRVEALRPRLVPVDDPFGLQIRTRLAQVLREHGRFAEARPLLEQTMVEAARLRKFWVENPQIAPMAGGEDFWTVSLRLVPKPAGP
jgi:hypothetical protein